MSTRNFMCYMNLLLEKYYTHAFTKENYYIVVYKHNDH